MTVASEARSNLHQNCMWVPNLVANLHGRARDFRLWIFNEKRNLETAVRICSGLLFHRKGPARFICWGTSLNFSKFLTNNEANLRAAVLYFSLSGQVLAGFRISGGTPGQAVGISRLKISWCSNDSFSSKPLMTAPYH